MSASREAYARYLLIDERLRRKPQPRLTDLVSFCSERLGKPVSERTLQTDLYNLRYDQGLRFEAPIRFDRSSRTYHYTDASYSIQGLPVSAAELQGLDFALSILEQFSHLTPIRQFEEAILRMADTVRKNRDDRPLSEFIRMEKAFPVRGTEWLEILLRAIGRREMIKFSYRRYGQDEGREHLIEPLLIREYRHFWYLVGRSRAKGNPAILTFALDRMEAPEATGYFFDAGIEDPEALYKDIIGVTRGEGEAENIELSFSPLQGQYLKTHPLHPSQTILHENDQEVRLCLKLVPNWELRSALLGYGAAVRVVSPDSLRDELAAEIKKMGSLYPL